MLGPTLPILLVTIPVLAALGVIFATIASLFTRRPAAIAVAPRVSTSAPVAATYTQARPAPVAPQPRATTQGTAAVDALIADLRLSPAPAPAPALRVRARSSQPPVVGAITARRNSDPTRETKPMHRLAKGSHGFKQTVPHDFSDNAPTVVVARHDELDTDLDSAFANLCD